MAQDINPLMIGGIAVAGLLIFSRGSTGTGGSSSGLGLKPVPIIDVQVAAAGAKYTRGSVAGLLKRRNFIDWKKIDGIVVHQVGVDNVGDGAWKKMTAHLGVTEDGRIYAIHPLNTYLYASNDFNKHTVAIEVGGNWNSGEPMTPEQINAMRYAILLAKNSVEKKGGKVKHLYAHRQSSSSRGRDPGPQIWQHGILWAEKKLGLKTAPTLTKGSGNPIKQDWYDPKNAPIVGGARFAATIDPHNPCWDNPDKDVLHHDHADLTPEELAEAIMTEPIVRKNIKIEAG